MSRVLLGIVAFLLALAVRLSNASEGVPQLSLADDLYHFKRMSYTAANFPHVLEFDPDRGVAGEFCPWPPLYDFAAGTLARSLGRRTPAEVLACVAWIPPLIEALFIGMAAMVVARHFGLWAGATLAIALAASPFLINESSIGGIDHHFLEPPLSLGIVLATCGALTAKDRITRGVWLGVALCAALFVRTALLIAAALAFALLFAFSDGLAAAIGFGIAGAAVALYRVTRPAGYPNDQWFLGWSHAALLGAAAAASLVMFLRGRRLIALACGIGVVLLTPSAPAAIIFGSEYLGGNPWFKTIVEGQPLWKSHGSDLLWRLGGLGAGAIFVWFLLWRRRDAVRTTIAIFAVVYLLLTISALRFWSAGIPLLALAGTVYAASIERRTLAALALAAVALPPVIQLVLWHPPPIIGRQQLPWVRAARFLRDQPGNGRVLAPWSMGHTIDVLGQRPVIIDNFGVMSNEITFDRAHDAFLAHDEEALARYCHDTNVRFIVLDNPLYGLQAAAAALGLDRSQFVRTNARNEPIAVTKLATSTLWWRAYYQRGPFRHFRLVYADPQASWEGTPVYRGPAVMIYQIEW